MNPTLAALLVFALPVQSALLHKGRKNATTRMLHEKASSVDHVHVDHIHNMTEKFNMSASAPVTFTSWYYAHTTGRGIWKWDNALPVYQRHFTPLMGKPLKLCEIGVQSGGSILMWQGVLGPQIHVYGMDINPQVQQFATSGVTITIADQGDVNTWTNFYSKVTPSLDILVDDGGHQPHQMGITLHHSFAHINPGGSIAIEDIHGRNFVQSFFFPAATSISAWHAQGLVASVHIHPFLLIVKKSGGAPETPPAAATTVYDFPSLWAALPTHAGKAIAVQNKAWGSFLAENALKIIFEQFGPLHDYSAWDNPPGCHRTAAAVCANYIRNNNAQAQITGVDVYQDQFIVHVPAQTPVIQAVRMGTEWLNY
eukprot:gnl/TRDRNA2_/TRDRNA2_181238_c0_seq1.p1 gnl/TRDRNA2_/TRDRNA2_181238_c0~~gnl/TRDRNA2_/TRDRNA2_181238_c0_seq1.p1  ORF type:complete len:368 (-),score=56.82 gnl/TRDRNA2_/TRDRNA2_181238_c0_seq1:107-1210(-)